ncbi:MAG: radical SAM protein [Elusimicrobia bacterium]|nr:radical SAM protein [Elusimicrobiota bacterium]
MENNKIVKALYDLLNPCRLCPQNCGVNRLKGEKGKCRTGNEFYISSFNVHHGEEPPISGYSGSGTIFFANCNLSCVFCQNYPISQFGHGKKSNIPELVKIMLELQNQGVHNINFVTPTHVVPWICEALLEAKSKGLKIPVVYNCGGYESIETLKLLDGVIDIYMPDAKYSIDEKAFKYSNAKNYWGINKIAIEEMFRQVGNLVIDKLGIAKKGLLIRHLVLPNDITGSKKVLNFISKNISPKTYLSLMSQYHPAHNAIKFPELNRSVSKEEYKPIVEYAHKLGLDNGWIQEL